MLTAAAVVLFGGTIYLWRHGLAQPQYKSFLGEPANLRSVTGILGNVFLGSGRGVIQLGVLLLIATPVFRVVLLLFGFAFERDRLYAAVSLVVLTCSSTASSAASYSVRAFGLRRPFWECGDSSPLFRAGEWDRRSISSDTQSGDESPHSKKQMSPSALENRCVCVSEKCSASAARPPATPPSDHLPPESPCMVPGRA